jgi:hypothetical protein
LNPTPTSAPSHSPTMETFEALRDQVSKITVYDIKSMYNQVRPTPNIRSIASAHRSVGLRRRRIWSSTSAKWRRRSKRRRMTNLGELCATSIPYVTRGTNRDQGGEFDAHAGDCTRVGGTTRTDLLLRSRFLLLQNF